MKNSVMTYRVKQLKEIYQEDSQRIMDIYDNADDFLKVVIIDQFISTNLKNDIYQRVCNDAGVLLKYLMFLGFNVENIKGNSEIIKMTKFFKNRYASELVRLYNFKIQMLSKDEVFRIKKNFIDEILNNVDLFQRLYISDCKTDIYGTIKTILNNKTISSTIKEEIIKKIIDDNDLFQSFSFNSILVNNLWMLTNKTVLKNIDVKLFLSQLFDKIEKRALKETILIKDREESQAKCSEMIETDLIEFIRIICRSININSCNNTTLINILETIIKHVGNDEYYGHICEFFLDIFSNRKECYLLLKKIKEKKLKYEQIINKIKKHTIPSELSNCSYDIGLSSFMEENFDEIMSYYLNREEEEIPKEVSKMLIVCYCNRLKKEFNVDFDVTFLSENVNYYTLGNYFNEGHILYLNPIYLASNKRMLLLNLNTIFHEVRHAVQMQKLYHEKEFDYANFLMVIDQFNSKRKDNTYDYYESNYQQISFECDARNQAYIGTMGFIKKYAPQLLNLKLDILNKNVDVTYNRVRKGREFYESLLTIFIDSINSQLLLRNGERNYCETMINEMNSKYPILFNAITYNKQGNYVRYLSKDEIIQLLNRYKSNEEVVNFYQNLLYDLEIANILERSNMLDSSSNIESGTIEELESKLNHKVESYQFVKTRK